MNIRLLVVVCLLYTSGYNQAQTINEKLIALLESRDMLELSRYYPQIKDSLNPSMDLLCKSFLAMAFNKPQDACYSLLEMSEKYPEQLSSINMIILWANGLYNIGEYQSASVLLNDVLRQLDDINAPKESTSDIRELFKINQALSKERKPNITSLQQESNISILRKDNDSYIYFNAHINGNHAEGFFDTGSVTVVNEKFALDNKVRFLDENMIILDGQMNLSKDNKFGIIDSLVIGNFCCMNIPCYIMGNFEVECDIIIGLDLLQKFNEVRIYPQKNELVLSKKNTLKTKAHNYMLWSKGSYIECLYGSERQTFHIDTGNNREGFYYPNKFETYKKRISNMVTPKDPESPLKVYQLNPFELIFGDISKSMTEFFVVENGNFVTTSGNEFPDGSIGTGFINHCEEFILNFENMYYEIK